MLEWLSLPAAPDEFPQRRQLCFRQDAFELQVELDPFLLEHVRQQMLRIQARALDLPLLKVGSRRLQNFKERHCSFRSSPARYPRVSRLSCRAVFGRRPRVVISRLGKGPTD